METKDLTIKKPKVEKIEKYEKEEKQKKVINPINTKYSIKLLVKGTKLEIVKTIKYHTFDATLRNDFLLEIDQPNADVNEVMDKYMDIMAKIFEESL
jgi:hypothetical protein